MTPPDACPRVQLTIVLPAEDDAPAVVRLQGELDAADVRTVHDELTPVIARTNRDVTIDMGDLGFIDVSGVNLLARTAATLTASERVLCLRAPSPMLVRMLQVTGLDQHLQIVEPSEEHRDASRP